jgi:ketosteroid isomerase-like protein
MGKRAYGLIAILLAAGCAKKELPEPTNTALSISADTLIRMEEAFSRTSEEKGFHAALKAFMSPSATKLVEGRLPIIGGDSIAKLLDSRPDTAFVITWKARHADIATSGDIGYTWGDWMLRPKYPKGGDTSYGNFYTVWKKQQDGSWKWVLDGGNGTPKPE